MLVIVQSFQTLIVGFLGFGGVIFTLWFNAWQARKQYSEKLQRERETLRVALMEELKIIRNSLRQNTSLEALDGHAGLVPTDPMDDIYRAFTQRIGLLSASEVEKVMYAYLSLRTVTKKLFVIGRPHHSGDHHVVVPAQSMPILQAMQTNLIAPIDEAIAALHEAGLVGRTGQG